MTKASRKKRDVFGGGIPIWYFREEYIVCIVIIMIVIFDYVGRPLMSSVACMLQLVDQFILYMLHNGPQHPYITDYCKVIIF